MSAGPYLALPAEELRTTNTLRPGRSLEAESEYVLPVGSPHERQAIGAEFKSSTCPCESTAITSKVGVSNSDRLLQVIVVDRRFRFAPITATMSTTLGSVQSATPFSFSSVAELDQEPALQVSMVHSSPSSQTTP